MMGGKDGMGGKPSSSSAESMLGGGISMKMKEIYRRNYVGLFNTRLFFERSIFLQRTSKNVKITTSTVSRRVIFHHDVLLRDPQTPIPFES